MTMFRHRQQLRRWALRVLLVWLFALGLGVANACLAAKQFGPGPSTASATAAASGAAQEDIPEGCDHHVVASSGVSQGDPHGTAAKSNCESFCERASVSIAPQKSMLDDLQAHALPAIALVSSLPLPADAPVLPWVPRRDGVRPRPIPITFLRLAL
jgi:hypothetical protein